MTLRVGHGYDVHRLSAGRPLILGGVTIPFEKGLLGHSDADVLAHAVADAVLGAAGLGDIGRHFPDSDRKWAGADSLELLERCVEMAERQGYEVVNADAVVIAQAPKLAPFAEEMRSNLAAALDVDADAVNIKAKTEEGLGFTGAGEAIAAHAVVLLEKVG
jgi:2-C-methyl-D-erythritol 2,4-cyclodiphosphate synthase